MSLKFDTPRLPGQRPVNWRHGRGPVVVAAIAAVCWPPLVLTMFFWPPLNWVPGRETDWRLMLLVLGAIAVPLGLKLLGNERARSGRPASRLGIVWRFMFYGGLLSGALQLVMALVMALLSVFESGNVLQALGAIETILLIYGLGGLPLAILVGVSYALWAGLCVAFLAFQPAASVPDRLGLMGQDITAN